MAASLHRRWCPKINGEKNETETEKVDRNKWKETERILNKNAKFFGEKATKVRNVIEETFCFSSFFNAGTDAKDNNTFFGRRVSDTI